MSSGLSLTSVYGVTTYAPSTVSQGAGAVQFKQQVGEKLERDREQDRERDAPVSSTELVSLISRASSPNGNGPELIDQLRAQLSSSRMSIASAATSSTDERFNRVQSSRAQQYSTIQQGGVATTPFSTRA